MSTVESQPAYSTARLLVIMGSSGCGKSTVSQKLAQRLGASFIEGDDYHPPQNKAKMSSGVPLTDDDRWPWLREFAMALRDHPGSRVASCSALKRSYRELITQTASEPVLFIYLHGDEALLAQRLSGREGHFMDKGLLATQLATLEPPNEQEFSFKVNVDQSVDSIIDVIEKHIKKRT